MTASMTLFTAPKPFTNPHIATIQSNAIASWKQLGDAVEIILIGNEDGIAQAAQELSVLHIPQVKCNEMGTPLISSMFDLARQASATPLYMIINADILIFPEILVSAQQVLKRTERFLIVGQRWDLDVKERIHFSTEWATELKTQTQKEGHLHPRGGSDYFIFPSICYQTIPDFAIGRAGWDNWMIYEARRRHWKAIDATNDIQIIHQNHDYSHLPDGKPHYRLPETFENVRLAGGARTIFTLIDTDYVLEENNVKPITWDWKKFWREVEIFPLVQLKSYLLAQLTYAIFRPINAYRDLRAWLRQRQDK